MDITVKNLTWTMTSRDLKRLFQPYGTVDECLIELDPETGRSLCRAYVVMPDSGEARQALAGLNNKKVLGYRLMVFRKKKKKLTSENGVYNEERCQGSDLPIQGVEW